MTSEQALGIFRKLGAVITDSHIVYTSGKHGTAYKEFRSILMSEKDESF